ncbi:DNA polymerase III subunit chi [Algicella marina]|uniref:DNA polymerase III subunit chi n=1 Tax=Algicella marina TaxID=2683284 RepID=A0A6P1SZG1_9RHOB|nr:DNA polymerase III subunit chi [Algicella marina]QHQ34915.1 DNA polymerase III subunit chi [Algicella marina]
MGEVLFYHLSSTPLERTLPEILSRTLQRGWRAVVRTATPARLPSLDALLWSFDPGSFLPHDVAGGEVSADTPVYLTAGHEVPNSADVLLLVDGARIDIDEGRKFERVCLFFDGADETMLQSARADWMAVKSGGLAGKYWAQENGRWVEKAKT